MLVHQAFVAPGEAGGTRHFELARQLVKAGHGFSIVAGNVNYLTGQRASAAVAEQYDGVRVLRAYTLPLWHRGYAWRLLSFFSFLLTSIPMALRAGPVDLVMGTTPPIFQAVAAWIVAVLRRRPLLLEVRDLWPEFAIDIGLLRNRALIALARRLERFLYCRASHLLVNSPAYRDYLIAKGVSGARITLIPNGAEVQMFDPADNSADLRRELGLEHNFVVTYAGAMGMANDLDTVLEAAALLLGSNVHFLLVGDGKERARLETAARARNLRNVTFLGAQPKSRVPAVLAASNACLAILKNIPMFRTTYPNKVFDYMAAGRPTLLAIDGVIRQVIEAAGAGIFVPPGDAAALAAAIHRLRGDPQLCKSMGTAARAYVVQHFNRSRQGEDFDRLISALAHGRGAAERCATAAASS